MKNIYEDEQRDKKWKLIKNTNWIVTVGLTTATLLAGGRGLQQIRENNDSMNSNTNYVVGYDNVSCFTNFITRKVNKNNFVLLDVGNHDSIDSVFKNMKLNYCQKNEIDVGLIIRTDAANYGDVYLDLEYVKSIMEKYEITYPVYLDVDCFFNNESLTSEEACSIIEAFLKKAEMNHFYVGVMGKKDNLVKLNNREELKCAKLFTDSFEDEEIICASKSLYYADLQLSNKISDNYYNCPANFREDDYFVYYDTGYNDLDDTLKMIADSNGISVQDLKKFNDIDYNHIENGTFLRIPSKVQNFNDKSLFSSSSSLIGIDVSYYQGDISWDKVDVDFAIIRLCDFGTEEKDQNFEKNVIGCVENDIPIGVYAYSRATSIDNVRNEAKYVIDQLKDVDVCYPVYLDLEESFWNFEKRDGQVTLNGMNEEATKQFVLSFIQTWENEIYHAGYIPGIYCSRNVYSILSSISEKYIDNLAVWVSGGEYYNQVINCDQRESLPNMDADIYGGMVQVSSKGIVNGIYNINSCYTDINYCYVDYENCRYHFDSIQPSSLSSFNLENYQNLLIFGGGILIGGCTLAHYQHRRKNKRKSRIKER